MIKNLDDYPFKLEQRVDWGDMDAFEHVNNVVFFRYFENARIAYLDKLNYRDFSKQFGVSVILGYIDCKFIRPLFYPDTITTGVKVAEVGDDRFNIDCAIYSSQQQTIVALSKSTIVTYDYKNNCKAKIPNEFKNFLQDS